MLDLIISKLPDPQDWLINTLKDAMPMEPKPALKKLSKVIELKPLVIRKNNVREDIMVSILKHRPPKLGWAVFIEFKGKEILFNIIPPTKKELFSEKIYKKFIPSYYDVVKNLYFNYWTPLKYPAFTYILEFKPSPNWESDAGGWDYYIREIGNFLKDRIFKFKGLL